MKTQKNISNLRKLGLVVLASMALVNGTMAEDKESANALVSLEIFVQAQEEALKYNAPAIDIVEAEAAEISLENFVNLTEASLKYVASEYSEADARAEEIAPALENLEMLATSMEAEFKYQAPAEDAAIEAVPAMEKLEMMAEATEASLKYKAPVAEETEVYDVTDYTVNEMLAETK
jgi:hypothetical protein